MSELLLSLGAGIFLIVALRVWRKHVLRQRPRTLQQSFNDFLKAEKARRVEKG